MTTNDEVVITHIVNVIVEATWSFCTSIARARHGVCRLGFTSTGYLYC